MSIQFSNIKNVQRLPETPTAYLCLLNLSLDGGASWEEVEYCARPGGGGICDAVVAAIEAGNHEGPIVDWEVPLSDAKSARRRAVDEERRRRIAEGFVHDGMPVQTRSEADFLNISGLHQMADKLERAGETGAVMQFRDADDVTHSLTPQEMMALGDAAFMHKSAHYAAAWDLKDAIDAAEDIEGVDAVNIYDDTAWP